MDMRTWNSGNGNKARASLSQTPGRVCNYAIAECTARGMTTYTSNITARTFAGN